MLPKNARLSTRSIALVSVLVVPMLLIPSAGQARSPHGAWGVFNQNVATSENGKTERQALRRFFDNPAPRRSKAMSRARNKRALRSRHSRRHAKRYGYADDYYDGEYAACATPRQIHRRLLRQGWRNFHNLRIRPNVLIFKARQAHQGYQGSELTYNLRVDRCSGSLIKAKLQFQDMWYLRWLRRLSWLR